MVKEISSFNSLPGKDESFVDFFKRVYPELAGFYPGIRFWLIEQFGKRASFIAGEIDEFSFNPVKKNLAENLYIFFSRDAEEQKTDKVFSYFADIYNDKFQAKNKH